MIIGFDIDGVLFPWADVANEVVVKRFGIGDPGPHVEWQHLKNRLTRPQWSWLWSQEGSDAVFGQIGRAYPGAVDAVNALLKAGHAVHFVTHRDPRRTSMTTALFLMVRFSRHPWAGVHIIQNSVKKRCLAHWDVFVDDKPETVYDFLDNTAAQVFAPARPWNTELEDSVPLDGFVRYQDPHEIVAWVEARS